MEGDHGTDDHRVCLSEYHNCSAPVTTVFGDRDGDSDAIPPLAVTFAADGLSVQSPDAIVPAQDMLAVGPGEPFVLEVGGAVRVMDETLTDEEGRLFFEEVVHDSRCPLKVNCARAGEAEVRLRLYYADGTEHEAWLEIPGMREFGVPTAEADYAEIAGYTIRFFRLDPYPVAEQEAPACGTRGTFVLERIHR